MFEFSVLKFWVYLFDRDFTLGHRLLDWSFLWQVLHRLLDVNVTNAGTFEDDLELFLIAVRRDFAPVLTDAA